MDGILAFGGIICLLVGIIAFFVALGIGLSAGFTKSDSDAAIERKARYSRRYKKAFLLAGLMLLVGTGMCALQFQLSPLNLH